MFNPGIAIIAKQKKIICRFRDVNATTPSFAIDPFVLGLRNGLAFKRLVDRSVLVEASPNLFYLDEARSDIYHANRRRIALVLMAVLLVVFTIFCFFAW